MSVLKMTDLDLAGKRVLIRADLNVPVKDGKVAYLKAKMSNRVKVVQRAEAEQ